MEQTKDNQVQNLIDMLAEANDNVERVYLVGYEDGRKMGDGSGYEAGYETGYDAGYETGKAELEDADAIIDAILVEQESLIGGDE